MASYPPTHLLDITFNPFKTAHCKDSTQQNLFENSEEVPFGSLKYFSLCGVGGMISCGVTHTGITPLDIVKCRIQVDPAKYKGIASGFKQTLADEGIFGLSRGWLPTFIGYSLQGLGKFGFYEVFKSWYSKLMGPEWSFTYRTWLYLTASASAEMLADVMLCPFEACKVRMQTQPGCSRSFFKVFFSILKDEGWAGLYKGLTPLWMRQVPYTMMKFACFERTVELLYKHIVPKPRASCSKSEQLLVTFVAGYIAGVFCAVVSHPADTVVSKLNQSQGSSAGSVLKSLGFMGMWKGLIPRIIMIGTLTAMQWFIYDGIKVYLHLPRPPPPEMPESMKRRLNQITDQACDVAVQSKTK